MKWSENHSILLKKLLTALFLSLIITVRIKHADGFLFRIHVGMPTTYRSVGSDNRTLTRTWHGAGGGVS